MIAQRVPSTVDDPLDTADSTPSAQVARSAVAPEQEQEIRRLDRTMTATLGQMGSILDRLDPQGALKQPLGDSATQESFSQAGDDGRAGSVPAAGPTGTGARAGS